MPVNLKLGEQLVEALIYKLKQNLPQRQNDVNAFFDDAVTIAPVLDRNYFPGRVAELQETPSIFVMEGPSTYDWEGGDGLISQTELLLYVFDSDQTGPLLAKRLQRQVRAVIEAAVFDSPAQQMLAVPPFAGLAAQLLRPVRTVPGTVFQPQAGDEWRAFFTIVFSATQLEN